MEMIVSFFSDPKTDALFIESILLLAMLYLYFRKIEGQIRWITLISTGGELDLKKLSLVIVMFLQAFTWLRLSLGLPINSALCSPALWYTFYIVFAAHDLIEKGMAMYKDIQLQGNIIGRDPAPAPAPQPAPAAPPGDGT